MSSLLHRLAVFSARRRKLVVGAWLVVLVALGVASHAAGTKYVSTINIPGSDSETATDVMSRSFSAQLTDSSQIVFHTDEGKLTDEQHRPAVESSLKALSETDNVEGVTNPYDTGTVSEDGRTVYSTVVPSVALGDLTKEQAQDMLDAAREPAADAGVQVEAGGQLGSKLSKPETHTSELVGIAAAMLILVLVFGTVTAMVLPIFVAIFGLLCGLSIVQLLSHVLSIPDVAPTVATMIGLGVGIDYSLFIVTRARSARHEGMHVHEAIGYAAATSGSAVAFAGMTVVVALLALAVSGITFVTMLGQAAAIVVIVAVAAATTLLPAMLGFCGDGIERLRVGRDRRPTLGHSRLWERWGARLASRPGVAAVLSILVLLAVASPVMKLELGLTDPSSLPTSTTQRQAYDLLTDGFGPGANGPLLVTADLGDEKVTGKDDPRLAELQQQLASADGTASVSPPQVAEDGTAALYNVIPKGSPTSDVTRDLVNHVRDDVAPKSETSVAVGGSTAQQLDLADRIGERLPLIIATVVALSMVLLLIAFRSVVAPIQAAVVNLLSVGAAYGIVTELFQEGHGASTIGLDGAIPIVCYVPMIMFAILFGLAMDYQVFLLSRVREEIDAGKSARRAVIDGLAGTGKVIASAAAIMVAVFASFILSGDPTVKEFGVGLSAAILIAGSMVCILLPAVMLVMGSRSWWLPRWLDRALPDISIEGPSRPELGSAPA
jgi:putative drug exporter of the RND superfamily